MEMKYKMADRKLIKLSKIHLELKSAELQGDWVTVGVIVHKSEPRTSSSVSKTFLLVVEDIPRVDIVCSFKICVGM